MLKNQKNQLCRKTVVAAVASILLSNIGAAQALPNTPSCNSLTRANISAFRAKVGTETTGAIALLKKANIDGEAARDPVRGVGGGWNYIGGLRTIASRLDQNTFLAPPCKSLFYPNSPEFGPSAGAAVPNNINACFRVDVTPPLEHEMYWSTLHVAYNYNPFPMLSSHESAEKAFYAVRDLLRLSRKISNDAQRCLLESSSAGFYPVLVGP